MAYAAPGACQLQCPAAKLTRQCQPLGLQLQAGESAAVAALASAWSTGAHPCRASVSVVDKWFW
eukprot:5049-Heterococcus_DN1.PRE.1